MFNNKESFKAEFTKRAVEQYGRTVEEIHISEKYLILGDMVKESGVDTHLIEEVKILSETSYEELPEIAKQRLGIEEHEKNILVRIVLRSLERTLTNEECNTYRDIIYRHVSTKEGYLNQNNKKAI